MLKGTKNPYNFFLILIFIELFNFKTSDEWQHWKTGSSSLDCKDINLFLRSYIDPFAFSTVLPRLSAQKNEHVMLFDFTSYYIEHVIFLILRPWKINLLMYMISHYL